MNMERGVTLVEVLVGGLIGSVLVAGVMSAFLTAIRINRLGDTHAEAAALAQQELEKFRNNVACDDPVLFSGACTAGSTSGSETLPSGETRTYTIDPADCDGVGGVGDCFKVVSKVTWTPPQ